MVRMYAFGLAVSVLIALGGCPTPPAGNGNAQENQNSGGGGLGNGNGNTNSGNGNANTTENSNSSNNGNGNGNGNGPDDGGGGDDDLFLRQLAVAEDTDTLSLIGTFGSTVGDVFVNGSARALKNGGWTSGLIEVSINPQDLGEVYVQVGNQTSNSRWITGWDFSITRTLALANPNVCPTCQAKMTWRFRMRNDVQDVINGPGNVTPGAAANRGRRGATFSIDSVNGSFEFNGEQRVFSREATSPVYYAGEAGATFTPGDGEWFAAFAGVLPAQSHAVVALQIDTDGYRVTNLSNGESFIGHISDFGVYQNLNYPGTIVMPLSPSLNIPSGSTQPDTNGSYWEWEAVPVQSPPPSGS